MIRAFVRLSFAIAGWYLLAPALVQAGDCRVTFGFVDDAVVSGVSVSVDYHGGDAAFVGDADNVDCRAEVPGAIATFNHKTDEDALAAALIRIEPFAGEALFSCRVRAAGGVDAGDFVVTTYGAAAEDATPIAELPVTAVTGIDCGDSVAASGGADVRDGGTCDVTFTLESDAPVSGLVFEAYYGAAPVDPKGSADGVVCTALPADVLGAYNDEEETASLIAALLHIEGLSGRVDVVRCRFEAPEGMTAGDLDVVVTDAVGPDYATLDPFPAVFVGDVACGTEEPAAAGGDDTPATGDGECAGPYDVTFSVEGAATLGALQLDIDYASANGEFVGSADDVACTATVPGFAMFNDQDGERTLKAGFVSVGGFQAPTEVVTCRFESTAGIPAAADFHVTVEDASTPTAEKVAPLPTVLVSSVTAAGDTGCGLPVCGNGIVETGEACDDGNADNTDACLDDCTVATCGDGYVQQGAEECDNGPANAETGVCRTDCTWSAVCGDVDGSGDLNATDAKRALNSAVGIGSDCTLARCDVNGSGSVTATDARLILNKAVGQEVELDCAAAIIVSLDDEVSLGGIELTVDYARSGGELYGAADDVACVSMLDEGALIAFNNDVAAKQLHVALVALPSIEGPTPLFACKVYQGVEGLSVDGFDVDVVDAIDPSLATVEDPAISVSW